MTTNDLTMTLYERNDHTAQFTITQAGAPFDITGLTIEITLKGSPQDDDSTGTLLSTATGEVTITDGPNGIGEVDISSTVTAAPATGRFFKLEVVNAGKRNTAGYGNYKVIDL